MSNRLTDRINFMIDIETLGVAPTSVITSIGIIMFDPIEGPLINGLLIDVDLESCEKAGLTTDIVTVKWWMNQSNDARRALISEPRDKLIVALKKLTDYIKDNNIDNLPLAIWAKAPSFDCNILKNAYQAIRMPIPWRYSEERCVRTRVSLGQEMFPEEHFPAYEGVKHNALDDAINQANEIAFYNRLIYNRETVPTKVLGGWQDYRVGEILDQQNSETVIVDIIEDETGNHMLEKDGTPVSVEIPKSVLEDITSVGFCEVIKKKIAKEMYIDAIKNIDNQFEKALLIAVMAHDGQFDKMGLPYIMHPIRVTFRLLQERCPTDECAAALLHDVIEDTDITTDDLKEFGVHKSIRDSVNILTRDRSRTYQEKL